MQQSGVVFLPKHLFAPWLYLPTSVFHFPPNHPYLTLHSHHITKQAKEEGTKRIEKERFLKSIPTPRLTPPPRWLSERYGQDPSGRFG